ncbi:hypothetical protein LKZ96_13835 [Serratia marcescens]|uniref:hypothetical protein n=1 Tax=Serratia marcescens TaxID=615 RepID=UPI001F352F47|nr:hypothetical protein [Serratia marcescens]UKG72770.1 hypothetical protein LKZ96_13835 [Serratia marcescens]
MLVSIISHIIAIVGATVCLAGGLAIAGLVISMASSYMWRSAKAAYSLGYLRYTAKIIHRRSMIRTAARRADKKAREDA